MSQANLRPFGAPPSKGRREKRSSDITIIYPSRHFYVFMRRTTISHFSLFIQTSLSNGIKGRAAPRANPEPINLNPTTSIP